jgi:hypothetical protein
MSAFVNMVVLDCEKKNRGSGVGNQFLIKSFHYIDREHRKYLKLVVAYQRPAAY